MNQFLQPSPQIDICFYNSLKQLKTANKCFRVFFFIRLLFVIYHLVDHLNQIQSIYKDSPQIYTQITILYILMAILNFITYFYLQWTNCKIFNNRTALYQIAQKIQHIQIVHEENLYEYLAIQFGNTQSQLKVSQTIYQFSTNLSINDIDQQYKKRAQRNCKSLIIHNMDLNTIYKGIRQFFNILSIVIFIFSVVILCKQVQSFNQNDSSFIITYGISEILMKPVVYIILLVIALSPLFCLIFCIYSCFCNKQQQPLVLPPTQKATLQIIRQCQGQCPICFQSIAQNQEIIILKCSNKHVFHDLCLKGWVKIGNTCPTCRARI